MFKFNSDNIFTGYLKQLLHDFNLPKYRIYTKEQADYVANYENYIEKCFDDRKKFLTKYCDFLEAQIAGWEQIPGATEKCTSLNETLTKTKEELSNLSINSFKAQIPAELNVLETEYRSKEIVYPDTIEDSNANAIIYPLRMRYMPYIKDGKIQEYVNGRWHDCHSTLSLVHNKIHKDNSGNGVQYYTYGQKILNYTKNLQIQNNVYDSYTHEYLGDYLRFHRDFANINLMPLYNCFSNRACPNLEIKFDIDHYKVEFNTNQDFSNALYKYYMVPVKFFKEYTIAIESEAAIEMCCCIYGASQNKSEKLSSIPKLTYQCISDSRFSKPTLYTKINNLSTLLNKTSESELAQYENDLKLILKIPNNNKSSIVILEGNYLNYNDVIYSDKIDEIELTNLEAELEVVQATTCADCLALKNVDIVDNKWNKITKGKKAKKINKYNKTVINLDNYEAIEYLSDKLITPLQLLRFNTGESYPFADRLIEYLTGNVITVNEEIEDNVKRVKQVINNRWPNEEIDDTNGIWEPSLKVLIYKYITDKYNSYMYNHDVLGFVDKDVEKLYSCGTGQHTMTMTNVDIYK